MINIQASYRQSFTFPAGLEQAQAYYADARRVLGLLPHISIVETFSEFHFRMVYHTTELGLYPVKLYCDLEVDNRPGEGLLTIRPWQNGPDLPRLQAGWYSLSGAGEFASTSRFKAEAGQTVVDYSLNLKGRLPSPLALRLLPGSVLEGLARPIVSHRVSEIASGFIRRSIDDYARQLA